MNPRAAVVPPGPVIFVTESLLEETGRLLASFATTRDSEGIVYWFGLELGQRGVVTTLVVPNAETGRGYISTSAAANAEAMGVMVDTPLVLIGQAHSHPRGRVNHSPTDDRDTFAQFPGALSVVVPFFGRCGFPLDLCGVHRHMNGRFERIPQTRLSDHLRILPSVADFRSDHDGI